MGIIYLVRHGNINYPDCVPGYLPEMSLSEIGLTQAAILRDKLAECEINYMFSSPLDRAKQTATILRQKCTCSYQENESFTEVNYGIWQGKKLRDLENDPLWKLYHQNRSGFMIPQGERLFDVQLRMIKAIFKITEVLENKNFLIVTHNEPIKLVLAYFLGLPIDHIAKINIDTCSVSIIYYQCDYCEIRGINIRDF